MLVNKLAAASLRFGIGCEEELMRCRLCRYMWGINEM